MAELATPSAATMATASGKAFPAPTSAPGPKDTKPKPEKPNEEEYQKALAVAEKALAAVQERFNAVKAKLDLTKPPAKDSPRAQKQATLRSELAQIRTKQQGLKSSKGAVQDKIKALDATLKARIAEQKAAKAKIPYKSVEDVDNEISRLEKQVDTGTMKLVDEKKNLAEISNLRKQRKGFAGFEEAQRGIDEVKAQLAELRKGLDDPESKALSERYTAIQQELDAIKAEQDEAYKGINELRDERTKIYAEQQEKYGAVRAVKDQYYAQKKAYSDYEHEAYLARKERQKKEREGYEKEKKRKIADKKMEEASNPAYTDEIMSAEGLIRYFDPSAATAAKATNEPGKFAAQAQRTIDSSAMKGMKVVKKDDDDYFIGGGGKKGKKGRKGAAATGASPAANASAPDVPGTSGKFNLSIGVLEELSKVDVSPPMSQADVPAVVEKLKEKLDFWKKDRDRKTKENVERAQKEIDRLEAEPLTPSTPPQSAGGRRGKHREDRDSSKKEKTALNGSPAAGKSPGKDKDDTDDVAEEVEKLEVDEKEAQADA